MFSILPLHPYVSPQEAASFIPPNNVQCQKHVHWWSQRPQTPDTWRTYEAEPCHRQLTQILHIDIGCNRPHTVDAQTTMVMDTVQDQASRPICMHRELPSEYQWQRQQRPTGQWQRWEKWGRFENEGGVCYRVGKDCRTERRGLGCAVGKKSTRGRGDDWGANVRRW